MREFAAHIRAASIKRTTREVDVAHQPEHQREAADDEETQPHQRYAIEGGADERPLAPQQPVERRRPDAKDHPKWRHRGQRARADGDLSCVRTGGRLAADEISRDQPAALFAHPRLLVKLAVLDSRQQLSFVLRDAVVCRGIAVHEEDVGETAGVL